MDCTQGDAQKGEITGGGKEVHYGAFKMVGLSFTDISQQQLTLFSLSAQGNKMKEFVWGQ